MTDQLLGSRYEHVSRQGASPDLPELQKHTYNNTSFLCVVLLPPIPHGMMADLFRFVSFRFLSFIFRGEAGVEGGKAGFN
jgi:hypothetical protein